MDGLRTRTYKEGKQVKTDIIGEVNDTEGTFEILLHMFLRNLKLQAQENTSDVMLIAGNHDAVSVDYFWNLYVHSTAKKFFEKNKNRENVLTPFYNNFSLFFGITNIETEQPNEISNFDILFMHGGIHYKKENKGTEVVNIFKNTLSDQKIIDKNNNNIIMEILEDYTNQPGISTKENVTWARDDATGITSTDDTSCERYSSLPTIIVGHCTNDYQEYKQPKDENRKCSDYIEYDSVTPLCIYPKCFQNKIPKVINIDTMMSGAFKKNTPEKTQAFEMLKICKGEEKGDFNKYTTVSINKEGTTVEYDLENVYNKLVKDKPSESESSPSGGKTRRRKRKTSNKSNRSKRIKKSKQTRKRGRKTRR